MSNTTSQHKTVVLGITSGIAAYKMLDFITLLKKEEVDVEVVMTASSEKMIDPNEVVKATGKEIHRDLFEEGFDYKNILRNHKVDHIDLADRADVIVIAPATANVIAKLAHGIADDFLTTMVLAANSPIILSPSMNVHMWNNPVTQENIAILKQRGYIIIPPEKGPLACGYEGKGRLPHLETIRDEVLRQLAYSKSLIGKRVIVTAGGTSEKLDDARVITNRSSGRMGVAIAEECHLRGADVLLFRAESSVEPRYVMNEEVFVSADDLGALLTRHSGSADVIFHVAAVSDFKPQRILGKISSKDAVTVDLVVQRKFINDIKKSNPSVLLIGFKAVSEGDQEVLVRKAKEKLDESGADVIVANDISRSDSGFGAASNEVVIVLKNGKTFTVSLREKRKIAMEMIHILREVKIL